MVKMVPNYNSRERRNIPRVPAKYFVRYRLLYPRQCHLGPEEYEGMTSDLSESGVSLITDKLIEPGTNIMVRFSLNNRLGNTLSSYRRIVVFTGVVKNQRPLEDGLYRIGIYFGPVKQENEKRFFEIICSAESSVQTSRFMRQYHGN